jgi:3-phenylpropionate/trans-cinnamate dioxygenase ferredoxin reductase subunit
MRGERDALGAPDANAAGALRKPRASEPTIGRIPVADEGILIVGGGLAAARCAETLRRFDYQGRVRVVCGESHPPYDRPPLSKELLDLQTSPGVPVLRSSEWFSERGIELIVGVRATELDATAQRVTLDDGSALAYEKLVITTGAAPRTLPLFEGRSNASTLRTFEDSQRIRAVIETGGKLALIGAGFIGQEVAAAARAAGAEVSVIEIEELPLIGVLGPRVARWFADVHREEGVELVLGSYVSAVVGDERVESLVLSDGRSLRCDHVLVGIGVTPEVGWLESAGFDAGGVATDELGRTALPNVYAAGDAAAVYDPFLRRNVLAGHWEAAARQGVQVAGVILDREPAPPPLSSFWSDQYGKRIQYLGHAPLADDVSIDGDPEQRDFVARYTRGGELVAALVVGRPRAVGELRERLRYMTERTPV